MMINRNADGLSTTGTETNSGTDEVPGKIGPSVPHPGCGHNPGGNFQIATSRAEVFLLVFPTRPKLNDVPFRYALFTVDLRVPIEGVEQLELQGVKIGARRWLSIFSTS
jgi:hypothetical protein